MVQNQYCLFVYFLLFISINTITIQQKDVSASNFIVLSPYYDHSKITIDKFLENQKHSYVVFIHDSFNNEYLVKQEKSKSLSSQFNPVFEKLTSYMAAIADISCQEVELLPINFCLPGKFFCDRPATIHKKLPGKTIRELGDKFFGGHFYIKQNNEPAFGSMGLNDNVIKYMSKHSDLPPIVAFDTFMGNRDRNRANILYDAKQDRFYAIDTALIHDIKNGKISVGQLACNYIEHINRHIKHINRQKKNIFNQDEYVALQLYYTVLVKLANLFSPETTYTLLEKFVEESGLKDKYGSDKEFIIIMNTYKERIYKAYSDTEKLIFLLTKLLKNLSKKFI